MSYMSPILLTCNCQDPDRAPDSRCAREPSVCGHELTAQGLGKANVRGIVSSHVGPELVRSMHQSQRRVALKRELEEIVESGREAAVGQILGQPSSPKHGDGLDVGKIGERRFLLHRQEAARRLSVRAIVTYDGELYARNGATSSLLSVGNNSSIIAAPAAASSPAMSAWMSAR